MAETTRGGGLGMRVSGRERISDGGRRGGIGRTPQGHRVLRWMMGGGGEIHEQRCTFGPRVRKGGKRFGLARARHLSAIGEGKHGSRETVLVSGRGARSHWAPLHRVGGCGCTPYQSTTGTIYVVDWFFCASFFFLFSEEEKKKILGKETRSIPVYPNVTRFRFVFVFFFLILYFFERRDSFSFKNRATVTYLLLGTLSFF